MNRQLHLTIDFYQVAARLNFTDDFCVTKIKINVFFPIEISFQEA